MPHLSFKDHARLIRTAGAHTRTVSRHHTLLPRRRRLSGVADDNIRPVTLPPLAMREMARLAVLFSSTKGALEGLASLVEEAKGTGERGGRARGR